MEEKITPKNSAAVGAGREFKVQIKEINLSDLQETKEVLLCPFSAHAVNDILAQLSYLCYHGLRC